MNKIKILLASLIGLSLFGCKDDYSKDNGLLPNLEGRYLTISSSNLRISSSLAQTASVDVVSENVPWQITGNQPDWVTAITPREANGSSKIDVTVTENPNADTARVCVMQFVSRASDYPYKSNFQITQEKAAPYVNVDKESILFSGKASNAEIKVQSNFNWTFASSNSSWITLSKEGDKLKISASENTSKVSREAYVSIEAGAASAKITVTQRPADITVSSETVNFSNVAGTKSVTIDSETSWSAATSYSWIQVSPTTGTAGSASLNISVTENYENTQRTGYIYLSQGDTEKKEIAVIQDGGSLKVSPTELSFAVQGESKTISIIGNMSWKLEPSESWIMVDKTTGAASTDVKVTVKENTSEADRTGFIKLCNHEGKELQRIYITQSGNTPDFDHKFTADKKTITISPAIAYSWNAQNATNSSWITFSPTSGNATSQLTLTVAANESGEARTGRIDMKFSNSATSHINIMQDGRYLTCASSQIDFFSKGGTSSMINLQTDGTPVFTASESWITVNKVGNAGFTVTAKENTTSSMRSATISVSLQGVSKSPTLTFSVRQAGQKGTFSILEYNADVDLMNGNTNVNPYPDDEPTPEEKPDPEVPTSGPEVKLVDMLVISDGYSVDYEFSDDAYRFKLCSFDESNSYFSASDESIIAYMESRLEDGYVSVYKNNNYYTWFYDQSPNTNYRLCVIAYDINGNRGKLCKYAIQTPSTFNQPLATVGQFTYESSSAQWETSVKMNSLCSKYYYLLYTGSGNARYPIKYAHELRNNYIRTADTSRLIDYTSVSISADKDKEVVFVTWGVDASGNLSNVVQLKGNSVFESASSAKKRIGQLGQKDCMVTESANISPNAIHIVERK